MIFFVLGVIVSVVLAIKFGGEYYIPDRDIDVGHFLLILVGGLIASSRATNESVRRIGRELAAMKQRGETQAESRPAAYAVRVRTEPQRAAAVERPRAPAEVMKQAAGTQTSAPREQVSLASQLEYALQFSTEQGARDHLKRILPALSPEEGEVLSQLLAWPRGELRAGINKYLQRE